MNSIAYKLGWHLMRSAAGFAFVALVTFASSSPAISAPTAEVAKKCIRYSYTVYPYQRPGAVKMSGNRQAYINDCYARNGDVPEPAPPSKP